MGRESWDFEDKNILGWGLVQDHPTSFDPGIATRTKLGALLGDFTNQCHYEFLAALTDERESSGVVLGVAWPRLQLGVEMSAKVNSCQCFRIVYENQHKSIVAARSQMFIERQGGHGCKVVRQKQGREGSGKMKAEKKGKW